MEDMTDKDAEYLVRRHELHVARQFMPELCCALVASSDTGLVRSIQALLRVVFGYKPEIKTACTAGGVLDGLNETGPDMILIDDGLFSENGIDVVSFLKQSRNPEKIVVFSRIRRPTEILAIRNAGVADVIHPAQIDSARLTESYIRVCLLSQLEDRKPVKSARGPAEVIALEPRSTPPRSGLMKSRIPA